MSTLHVVKLGGVAVHKDGAVSTVAFSLNWHDNFVHHVSKDSCAQNSHTAVILNKHYRLW